MITRGYVNAKIISIQPINGSIIIQCESRMACQKTLRYFIIDTNAMFYYKNFAITNYTNLDELFFKYINDVDITSDIDKISQIIMENYEDFINIYTIFKPKTKCIYEMLFNKMILDILDVPTNVNKRNIDYELPSRPINFTKTVRRIPFNPFLEVVCSDKFLYSKTLHKKLNTFRRQTPLSKLPLL